MPIIIVNCGRRRRTGNFVRSRGRHCGPRRFQVWRARFPRTTLVTFPLVDSHAVLRDFCAVFSPPRISRTSLGHRRRTPKQDKIWSRGKLFAFGGQSVVQADGPNLFTKFCTERVENACTYRRFSWSFRWKFASRISVQFIPVENLHINATYTILYYKISNN